ncbi:MULTISPECIES: cupredoxin family copper-binding protein [unclassified Nostoc]|uniref:cupredoxin domain-containing protein n=1 Tax=unclassified Nostoc TaxID=2593658 RepID=UPI002AD21707|nr:cupredoxin family copper-binding protein [Nostoc sp. DedQUE03]MDZ7973698.1 cupredoxin family copper-binding protein [Nostoc sp. DedQUE03]MDZ8048182.1 cupredoxin family copper-binding protein [Nostoc sp. DedQUE02]
MKYISYFLIAIASAFLVILLSLSSCSPNPKTTTMQPMVMKQLKEQPKTNQQPADVTVKIRNFKFEPANLALAVGKTVQFLNVDEEPHTATATDGTFNSKALDTNETWNYTATKPGTYPYICSIHPFMKGTLTVTNKKN